MAKFDIPKQYRQQTTNQGSGLSNITVNKIEPDEDGNIEITAKNIDGVLTINDIPQLPTNLVTKEEISNLLDNKLITTDNLLDNITNITDEKLSDNVTKLGNKTNEPLGIPILDANGKLDINQLPVDPNTGSIELPENLTTLGNAVNVDGGLVKIEDNAYPAFSAKNLTEIPADQINGEIKEDILPKNIPYLTDNKYPAADGSAITNISYTLPSDVVRNNKQFNASGGLVTVQDDGKILASLILLPSMSFNAPSAFVKLEPNFGISPNPNKPDEKIPLLPMLDAVNLKNISSDNVIINYKFAPVNVDIESGDTVNMAFLKTQGQLNRISKEKPTGNWWFDEENGEDTVIVSIKIDDVDYNVIVEPFSKEIIKISYEDINLAKKTIDQSILKEENINEINSIVDQYLTNDLKLVSDRITSINNGSQYRPFKTFGFLKTKLIGEVSATINLPSVVNEFLDFRGLNNLEITVIGLGSTYQLVNTSSLKRGFFVDEAITSFKLTGCRFNPVAGYDGNYFSYCGASQFNVIENNLFDSGEEDIKINYYLALGIVGSGQKFIIKSNAFTPSQIKTKIRFIGSNTYRAIVQFDDNDLMDSDTEELYAGSKEDYLPTIIRDVLNVDQTKTQINIGNSAGYEIELKEATESSAGIITADYKKRLDALLDQANL